VQLDARTCSWMGVREGFHKLRVDWAGKPVRWLTARVRPPAFDRLPD
jgi:hypothetical protein